jgi:hypothetical protein
LAEFWFLADWPPYSPDLNSLDFSTGSILQAKGHATPHANYAGLASGGKNPQDLPLIPLPPLSRC